MDTSPSASADLSTASGAGYGLDLQVLVSSLIRRWRLIAGIALAFFLLGALYVMLQVPLYTASAELQLNTQDQGW